MELSTGEQQWMETAHRLALERMYPLFGLSYRPPLAQIRLREGLGVAGIFSEAKIPSHDTAGLPIVIKQPIITLERNPEDRRYMQFVARHEAGHYLHRLANPAFFQNPITDHCERNASRYDDDLQEVVAELAALVDIELNTLRLFGHSSLTNEWLAQNAQDPAANLFHTYRKQAPLQGINPLEIVLYSLVFEQPRVTKKGTYGEYPTFDRSIYLSPEVFVTKKSGVISALRARKAVSKQNQQLRLEF